MSFEPRLGKKGRILDIMKPFEEMTAQRISQKTNGEFSPHEVAQIMKNLLGKYVARERKNHTSEKGYKYAFTYWRII